jgi:fucose 4-O-acetylase-like acetyltransferase
MTGRERRADIDWLRVGAVYLLLAFHSAKVFDQTHWHVKDGARSGTVDAFTSFVHQWHMPLLFVLAGWAMTPSLARRGARAVRRERRERLLVPFAFGTLTLVQLAAFVESRHSGEPMELTWMHLWFLIYLFTFTLLYLPLFEWLRARDWRVERVPPGAVYAAIVPFALVQVALRGRWPGYQNLVDDWANFAYYSLFFFAGFLLTRFPAIEAAVHRERRRAALIGAAAIGGMAALAGGLRPPDGAGSPEWVAFQALSAVAGACLVMALLGFAHARLRARVRVLAYARDSAMPVYVLHQPLIVFLAVPVVALPLGAPVKLAVLLAGSTVATIGAYHLAVRRSRRLSALLGSKAPTRRGLTPARAAAGRRARERGGPRTAGACRGGRRSPPGWARS